MRNSIRDNGWFDAQLAPNARQLITLLLTILLVISSLLVQVEAADGDLDQTFGAGGKVTTDFIGGSDFGSSLAIQSDGKIVTAGYVLDHNIEQVLGLARYDTDGNLDPTFGAGGKVMTGFILGSLRVDIAIQNDGKIVVLGTVGVLGNSSEFLLARYDTNGNPDPSFGTGGAVTTSMFSIHDEASAVAIQSDGKIVVAGRGNGFISDFVLARFDANGNLDATFGAGGKIATDFFGFFDSATDVAVQSDGKIIAVGVARNGNNFDLSDFALARYDANGNLDPTFGAGGKMTTDFFGRYDEAKSVAIQKSDGKIVVAGTVDNVTVNGVFFHDFGLARYDTDGSLDPTFGAGGKVSTDFFNFYDEASEVVIQSDGKIVVAGSVNPDRSNIELVWDFGVARYDTNGNLDPAFGVGGKVTTDFLFHDEAGGVAIQQGCKIVVAGFSWPHETGNVDFALARYDSGGCPVETPSCPLSQGYWKNHASVWPVDSLVLGNESYTKAELLAILDTSTNTDASLILARQLIAAKLNLANGSDPAPLSGVIAHADGLLSGIGGRLPLGVKPSSITGQEMIADGGVLDSYNNRLLTPGCAP